MKNIFCIFISLHFLVSCHPNNDARSSSPVLPFPSKEQIPAGDSDVEDKYPIPMITNAADVQEALKTFKIAVLNGYCNSNPGSLAERGNRMSFDGSKVTFELRRDSCTEVIEREGKWIYNGIQATLLVRGGSLKSSCPKSEPVYDVYQLYNFDIDKSARFVAIYSTNAKGCWWAKKIE